MTPEKAVLNTDKDWNQTTFPLRLQQDTGAKKMTSGNSSEGNAPTTPGANDAALLARHYERENARIARILHDGPAQKLTAAMIELSLWKGDLEQGRAPTSAGVQEMASLLQSISTEMRDATSRLRARALDLFGVNAAVESLIGKRAHCRFRPVNEVVAMEPDAAIQLIRILEAVLGATDAAMELEVVFEQVGSFAVLRLQAAAALVVPADAAARARAFGGTIEGQGTTLIIRLPLAPTP